MKTYNLTDIVQGTSTNTAGEALYVVLENAILNKEKVRVSLIDATPFSTSFMNSSIGAIIENYGIEHFREFVAFVGYTKSQASIIKNYIQIIKKVA